MTDRLDGTVALVTGASSGIGEATARELSSHGAAVVVAARRKDRLDALVDEIEGAGGSTLAVECDVTDRAQAVDLVAATVDRFGRLDTLVNNAGVMLSAPSSTDMETLHAVDIAETIAFIVTRPRRAAVNELLIRPTQQQG